jgi:hypothetical protein
MAGMTSSSLKQDQAIDRTSTFLFTYFQNIRRDVACKWLRVLLDNLSLFDKIDTIRHLVLVNGPMTNRRITHGIDNELYEMHASAARVRFSPPPSPSFLSLLIFFYPSRSTKSPEHFSDAVV